MNACIDIMNEIILLLKKSKEELRHARNTIKWLQIIKPNPGFGLYISALAHDIERTAHREDQKKNLLHKEFKLAHSIRSADIVMTILRKHKLSENETKRVYNIILFHEFGGIEDAKLVKDADSLANLQWCDEMFGRMDIKMIKQTIKRMCNRMEKKNRGLIKRVELKHPGIKKMVQTQVFSVLLTAFLGQLH